MTKQQIEVPDGSSLEQITQLGIRLPDGTIIWADLGKTYVIAAWRPSGENPPLIYLDDNTRSYYDKHYSWDDATTRYQEHLAKIGANYDPETDVLERVSRQVIVATTKPTVV
jgi:hypothetical protein